MIEQRIDLQSEDPIEKLIQMEEAQKWILIGHGMEKMVDSFKRNRSFLALFFDMTKAGGKHWIPTYFDASLNVAHIQVPSEPEPGIDGQEAREGGRFTTMLHAIEGITRAGILARTGGHHPVIQFSDRIPVAGKPDTIVIPLNVYPQYTNLIVVHKQLHRINSQSLVHGYFSWYKYYASSPETDQFTDWLRHTMIVHPKVTQSEDAKHQIKFSIVPHDSIADNYNLIHTGRLSPIGNFVLRPDNLWFAR